uniref:Uncharacterized protein n=1 Tax=Knipowitschia caucasica TaxID=637954 RepID=A0AAV2M2V2_KNICA
MQERNQELTAQYEKKQKELKNLCLEEGQLRRALAMKQDKESKQSIRRQKKKEMKEQHIQEVMGHCNLIQQKREEMADKMQAIRNETQDLKDKMQSLRDACKQDTSRAQALFDALSAALANLHQQMDVNIQDITNDLSRKTANF